MNLDELAASLDPQARDRFGKVERIILGRSMERCGMEQYPPVAGDPNGIRVDGSMLCPRCGLAYFAHPLDWRVIGYGDVPFLTVLCDGQRVKL